MKINRNYFNSTSIALFILIIWDAAKVYLSLGSTFAQMLVLFPAILIGLLDNSNKRFWRSIFSPPCSIWFLWIIYALINTFILNGYHHHRDQNAMIFISAIVISYLFLLLIVNAKIFTDSLINILIWAYVTRLILSYIFDRTAIAGNDIVARFGSEFNSNLIAFGAIFIIALITIKKFRTSHISKFDFIFLIISTVTIFITGSKKSFLCLTILAVGIVFISRSQNFFKNILKYSFYSLAIVFAFLWTLQNTPVGSRLIDTFTKTSEAKSADRMFDNRMAQYIEGWNLFKENPINGVGLSNFVYASGYNCPLHTEYMVQMAECGLIGVGISLIFYLYIFHKLLFYRNASIYHRSLSELHILSILIMFILFFGGWIYNIPMMWVMIALAIRFIKESDSFVGHYSMKTTMVINEKYRYIS